MAKRKCKHAFMLAMLRDGSTHRAFVVDIGRLPEPDYMNPDVLSIKCGDCHDQMGLGETSDDYELGAWLPPLTSFTVELAASPNGWSWDPSRPVAGQYEESLNASLDEQLAAAKDKMREQNELLRREAWGWNAPVREAALMLAKHLDGSVEDPGLQAVLDSVPLVSEEEFDARAAAMFTCDPPTVMMDASELVVEQTRHDVAASVARHVGIGEVTRDTAAEQGVAVEAMFADVEPISLSDIDLAEANWTGEDP